MKNIVYGLKDPRNDLFYYIGKSTVGKDRPIKHLTESHSGNVNEWIDELKENWVYPDIEIIEEVNDINDLLERESYWISYYHDLNPGLLNIQGMSKSIEDVRTDQDDEEFNDLLRLISKIPDILRRERIARGISQDELASRMNVSRSTLSLMERGLTGSLKTAFKFALELKGSDILYNYNRQRS